MPKLIKPFCILGFLGLSACTSVTDNIPTVKIERKKPKVIQTTQANYTAPKVHKAEAALVCENDNCLLYTSPSPRDRQKSRMPSSA